jgi:hypothetical protein
MPPYRYRISYAQPADEVLRELRKFVNYVKSGPVNSLLPSTLHDIGAQDASDVTKWQKRIERVLRETPAMSATERYWLDEMNNLFKAAQHRLDELVGARRDRPGSSGYAR